MLLFSKHFSFHYAIVLEAFFILVTRMTTRAIEFLKLKINILKSYFSASYVGKSVCEWYEAGRTGKENKENNIFHSARFWNYCYSEDLILIGKIIDCLLWYEHQVCRLATQLVNRKKREESSESNFTMNSLRLVFNSRIFSDRWTLLASEMWGKTVAKINSEEH